MTSRWLETTWRDVRFALRGLARNPAFAITAILSLVLGIGASLAIFTVTDSLLLRPLPYRDARQITLVWERNRQTGRTPYNAVAPGNFVDWRAQNQVFESMAGFRDVRSVLSDGSRAEELENQYVTAELMPMLGVQPSRGRLISPAEDRPGAEGVVLISHRIWQNWFGGDENIVGRKTTVDSRPATIIGVMPSGFYFISRETELWQPLGLNPANDYRKTDGRWMRVAARMKSGVTREQAQSHMEALAARLEAAYPAFDKNWTVNVEPLRDAMVREVKTSLLVLTGAVVLLLAVATANVANLLLARYTARRREIAVRLSLGAARGRIIRQLLTESILLGLAGGIAGIVAARWAVTGLLALAPRALVRGTEVVMDWRILIFAAGLSLLTGILFGLAPALVTSAGSLIHGLRDDTRGSIGTGGHLRSWLVGAEVALSVVLLVGASLLFRSVVGLQAVDPGLKPENVLTARVTLPGGRYGEAARRTQFFARAVEQMEQLPGVRSASAISFLPFAGMAAGTHVGIAGRPPAKPGEEIVATIRTVMPGYFKTMGIPIKRGRDFNAADNAQAAPIRFMVNEAFARGHLAGEEPIGKQINAIMSRTNPFGEIVGVVGDVKDGALDQEPRPTVYYNHAHLSYGGMVLVLRVEQDPLTLAEPVRRIVRGIDPAQPVAEIRTMDSVVAETFARQRFSAQLLSGFSITSLLLAAIGIYGVLAYSVSERTREIGVRVALGAEPGRIVRMIVGAGARVVVIGTAAGIGGAFALTGFLKKLLFGIGPRDATTFTIVPAVLLAVALAAAYVPARRASRLDPMEALRE
jgi:putative ABC transport system permease protein